MLTGIMPWAIANKKDGWYQAYVVSHDFLRYTLPISEEADYILQRIFTNEESDVICLEELRQLIEGVAHFWMSEDEITGSERHLQRVAENYQRQDLDVPTPYSWSSDSSWDSEFNSLEDESDDSDEHSIGMHTDSMLAMEEGCIPGKPPMLSSQYPESVADTHIVSPQDKHVALTEFAVAAHTIAHECSSSSMPVAKAFETTSATPTIVTSPGASDPAAGGSKRGSIRRKAEGSGKKLLGVLRVRLPFRRIFTFTA
jgi:hypothetical protein